MIKRSLITILLTIGFPVFAEESSPLFLDELETLAQFQETDVLKQLVRDYYAKDPNLAKGKYPSLLHDAAIFGMSHLLRYLITNGPHNFDYAYVDGPTSLGYIAGDNQLEAAKILLEAGASPSNPGNTKGIFPLSSAIVSGNMKMIELLLKHGAIVHIGTYYQSPLGITLEKNDIEILQLFVGTRFKLDPNDPELRILVIEYLNSDLVEEEVLRILIGHGFDIYAKAQDGDSFIEEYGKLINYSDVKQMLEDVSAEFNPSKSLQEESKKVTPVVSDDPTSSAKEASKLKDALTSYITGLDDSSLANRDQEENAEVKAELDEAITVRDTNAVKHSDGGENTENASKIHTQSTEPSTTNIINLNSDKVITHSEPSESAKTSVDSASAMNITNDTSTTEKTKTDKEETTLSEIGTQNIDSATALIQTQLRNPK